MDINQTNTHSHQIWPSENTLSQPVCRYKFFTGHNGTFFRNKGLKDSLGQGKLLWFILGSQKEQFCNQLT